MPYVSTAAKLGYATLFGLSDNAAPPTFTTVAEVVSVTGPALKRDKVDATFMESAGGARESIYSVLDAGEVTLELNFLLDPTQEDLENQIVAASPTWRTYRIAWPDMQAQALTVTEASGTFTTTGNHNFDTPQPVIFSTTGTLPGGLVAGQIYAARYASADTFTLFANSADAAANTNQITPSDGGTGTHTVHSGAVWTFEALITAIEPTAKTDEKLTASVTFQVTGSPTL